MASTKVGRLSWTRWSGSSVTTVTASSRSTSHWTDVYGRAHTSTAVLRVLKLWRDLQYVEVGLDRMLDEGNWRGFASWSRRRITVQEDLQMALLAAIMTAEG